MLRCKTIPYEGTKPYAFVSYAHKDSEKVYPVIEALEEKGYRIWYDDGIAPGSEWPENIATHLAASSIVLVFVSPMSIASDNCRREVTFALSKKKPILSIVLEPTEMSPGMEMQLSAQQSVLKYNYQNDSDFYNKVFSCDNLDCCLESEDEDGKKKIEPISEEPEKPTEDVELVEETVDDKKRGKKEKRKTNKKLFPILGGVAACIVAVIISIVVVVLTSTVRITDVTTANKKDTGLSLFDEVIDADAVKAINKLKALEQIEFYNCTFEEGVISELELHDSVHNVLFSSCHGIENLDFLKGQNLSYVTLSNSGITDEMLKALDFSICDELYVVDVSGNPDITDLSLLKDNCDNLEKLYFNGTNVSDLSMCSFAPQLKSIDGSKSKVTDISCLGDLDSLVSIKFSNCSLKKLPERIRALRLEEIDLTNTGVSSFDMFSNCTVLKNVYLSGTAIEDISILEKSTKTLTEIDVGGLYLIYDDVKFLSECKELEKVILDGIRIEILDILSKATKLTYLSAENCNIKDISRLYNCKKLSYVNLAYNEIDNVFGLTNIVSREANDGENGQLKVNLNHNKITSASSLPEVYYEELQILNRELNINTLPESEIYELHIYYTENLVDSEIPYGEYATVVVVDCPEDKKVEVEDFFMSNGSTVVFIEEK